MPTAAERRARRMLERKDQMSSTSKRELNQLVWGTVAPIGVMLFLAWKLGGNEGRHWVWEDASGA
jgi:hypothetical protein